jgi:hypothetical protein
MPPLPGEPAVPLENPAIRPQEPTDGIPRFFHKVVHKADGSYANVEFVEILTPGDNKAVPVHKVNDFMRQKYPWHYQRWKAGLQVTRDGVPIEMFPVLDPAQVQMLKALNVFSVEDLANIADANLHRIPMGTTMRQSARDWLKNKKETDEIHKQNTESEALKANQNMLEKQIAELSQRLLAAETKAAVTPAVPAVQAQPDLSDKIAEAIDTAGEKRKPGRPPKSKED